MKLFPVFLFHAYLPNGNVAKNLGLLACAAIIAHSSLPKMVGSSRFERAILRLNWGSCQGYPNSSWKTSLDGVPLHHPTYPTSFQEKDMSKSSMSSFINNRLTSSWYIFYEYLEIIGQISVLGGLHHSSRLLLRHLTPISIDGKVFLKIFFH